MSAAAVGDGRPAAAGTTAPVPGRSRATTEASFQLLKDLRAYLTARRQSRWVVQGLIPTGLTVLYGESSSGKSFVALGLAEAIAGGLEWVGRKADAGSVLIVAAEDPIGCATRLVAAEDLQVLPRDTPIALATPDLTLGKTFEGWLRMAVRELGRTTGQPVRAVIIDTLGAIYGPASQDEADCMTTALDPLVRTAAASDLAIIVVHHTRKTGGTIRGSRVLVDRADAVFRLERRGIQRCLVNEKQRNGQAGDRIPFALPGASRRSRLLGRERG